MIFEIELTATEAARLLAYALRCGGLDEDLHRVRIVSDDRSDVLVTLEVVGSPSRALS